MEHHMLRRLKQAAMAVGLLAGLTILGVSAMAATATTSEDDMTQQKTALATFAGGCFWCMEHPFDKLDGVISTTSGYTGGHKHDPTYKEVSSGTTGHTEAVQIVYAPDKVEYRTLLDVFWRNHDPLDTGGQFCDRGGQYRSSIFYHDEEQKRLAEESRAELDASGVLPEPIATPVVAATTFYPAEEYHQDYYQRNPVRYNFYRYGCGRDKRLEELWGKP